MIIPPSSWLDYVANLDRPPAPARRRRLFPRAGRDPQRQDHKADMVPALDWPQSLSGCEVLERQAPINSVRKTQDPVVNVQFRGCLVDAAGRSGGDEYGNRGAGGAKVREVKGGEGKRRDGGEGAARCRGDSTPRHRRRQGAAAGRGRVSDRCQSPGQRADAVTSLASSSDPSKARASLGDD
ncbi:uncharacterized protein LOC124307864 [Neodiprion virginianus]|uniref:uncharacterized protein LOC124307864 n=1 Tax=Neodiprion virginianus TaxID=2961670 RepID=UPI001EDE3B68|nr:uncharacterized protein LOC124222212 [Neodiprion pinetum]XP_046625973.1 uncharacterized protein LOC124307864 [Neodiprion virginianus]